MSMFIFIKANYEILFRIVHYVESGKTSIFGT